MAVVHVVVRGQADAEEVGDARRIPPQALSFDGGAREIQRRLVAEGRAEELRVVVLGVRRQRIRKFRRAADE